MTNNHMTDLTQFFNFSRPSNGASSTNNGGAAQHTTTTAGQAMQQQQQMQASNQQQQQAAFDINEFPSLSKMSLLSQMQVANANHRANYVNIALKDTSASQSTTSSVDNANSAQSEFTISSEDFPALPGSLPSSSPLSLIANSSSSKSVGTLQSSPAYVSPGSGSNSISKKTTTNTTTVASTAASNANSTSTTNLITNILPTKIIGAPNNHVFGIGSSSSSSPTSQNFVHHQQSSSPSLMQQEDQQLQQTSVVNHQQAMLLNHHHNLGHHTNINLSNASSGPGIIGSKSSWAPLNQNSINTSLGSSHHQIQPPLQPSPSNTLAFSPSNTQTSMQTANSRQLNNGIKSTLSFNNQQLINNNSGLSGLSGQFSGLTPTSLSSSSGNGDNKSGNPTSTIQQLQQQLNNNNDNNLIKTTGQQSNSNLLIGNLASNNLHQHQTSSMTTMTSSSLEKSCADTDNKNENEFELRQKKSNENDLVCKSGMIGDQFGMMGLLAFLRAAETDPNLASVTFGTDLTALGLNLTAQDKLYPSFAGPWCDQPLKVHEIDYPVPSEYLINSIIADKLAPIQLKRYQEDTLFFLFYMFPNEMLQMAAADELYLRDWRFHKKEKVWITRVPGLAPPEKTQTYERGTYYFFDPHDWRRVLKEFHLRYTFLENKTFTLVRK